MSMDDLEQYESEDESSIENTYLTFSVAGEEYAVHVSHVTEIVRLQKIFSVPDVPRHVRGVINLRGKVIPLLDVRARFGLNETNYTDRTLVVVIEVGSSPTGLIVDGVYDVAEFPPQDIEAAPTSSRGANHPLITRMGKRSDRISLIVDVPSLVASSVETRHKAREIGVAEPQY
jgi:purine-binding chemotaxis protein CheW